MSWPKNLKKRIEDKLPVLRVKYPDVSDEVLKYVAKYNVRLLRPFEQTIYCNYIKEGHVVTNIHDKMHVHKMTCYYSRKAYKDFDLKCRKALAGRVKLVEVELEQYILGKLVKKKTTFQPILDKEGLPTYDEKGKQKLYISKVEEENIPPNANLVAFYLKARKPELYNRKDNAESDSLPTVQLEDEIVKLIKAAG